ncbi:SPOR domain-containing protein [Fluviicola chungangensis]|uniref:SPOR domain-containing protein n=1 Tax=Fluviicola chungangensis TaxID=2597671 RepID=A0A556N5W1_9FLAO|nr:SPOR domain-containing protein [Fluviicola chungangensis]TSJ47567.1 hypothetical protein FO442_00120 [Fluviicola chungangensis]
MNNYLLQLLKEVKTLIIPGLGALTVTNESTGEILFMPYLKFDDGTLAKHIASKENMDLNDASNLISKFVREVTIELDKGNSYDMYQFGRFVKVDGEIAFEAWTPNSGEQGKAPLSKSETAPPQEKIAETPKVETPPVAETPKAAEPPKKEEPKEEKAVPAIVEEQKTPKTEPVPIKEETKKKAEVPPVMEEPKKESKPAEVPKAQPKPAAQQKEPVKKEKPVKEPKAPKEKKKSSVLSYILWGFLVLILGSGTFIAIKFDTLKKDFPILADLAGENDDAAKGSEDVKQLEDEPDVNINSETASEPVPEDEVQVVEDKLPEETVNESNKTTAPAPKPKTTVTVNKKPVTKTQSSHSTATFDGSKHFHVIAGSFGSEANANRLAGKLQSKGFAEASVTMNGGMYRVSVKRFATLNEATAEAASIQSSVPGAWVLKM